MYLLLLIFGGLLSAAGLVLAAAGVSLHDRTFDTTIVTPGVVAVVGGLLLIGLGLALRILQRIEKALALRQVMPAETLHEPGQIPLPKPALRPPITPPPASAEEKRVENLPGQAPALARLETTPAAEETALAPAAVFPLPTSVDIAVEAEKARTVKRKNGAMPGRLTPRLDMSLRAPSAAGRPAGPSFDTLWPKGPRPIRAAPPPSAQLGAVPAIEAETGLEPAAIAAVEPQTDVEPAIAQAQALAPDAAEPVPSPEPVSVLKSGVVDGMAYTLYSDGSIEAQLPQGTLRFGSITELRNHIEQSA